MEVVEQQVSPAPADVSASLEAPATVVSGDTSPLIADAGGDAPAESATAPATPDVIEYTLAKPILSYGKKTDKLSMRLPTGADLIRYGNPVIFYPFVTPAKTEHDPAKFIPIIAALARVPSPSIETLSTNELVGIFEKLEDYFLPDFLDAKAFTPAKPLQTPKGEIAELRLRDLTTADFLKIGSPVTIYRNVDPIRIEHDYAKVAKVIGLLADVPADSLGTLQAAELIGLAWAILPFFLGKKG
jgi:hypothetical protein